MGRGAPANRAGHCRGQLEADTDITDMVLTYMAVTDMVITDTDIADMVITPMNLNDIVITDMVMH